MWKLSGASNWFVFHLNRLERLAKVPPPPKGAAGRALLPPPGVPRGASVDLPSRTGEEDTPAAEEEEEEAERACG
jgi:hypothetical protein